MTVGRDRLHVLKRATTLFYLMGKCESTDSVQTDANEAQKKRRDDISICGYLKDVNTKEEMN